MLDMMHSTDVKHPVKGSSPVKIKREQMGDLHVPIEVPQGEEISSQIREKETNKNAVKVSTIVMFSKQTQLYRSSSFIDQRSAA